MRTERDEALTIKMNKWETSGTLLHPLDGPSAHHIRVNQGPERDEGPASLYLFLLVRGLLQRCTRCGSVQMWEAGTT
jgi:hypothetical protein